MITILKFDQHALSSEDIRKIGGLEYTYLCATTAMARFRKDIIPEDQIFQDHQGQSRKLAVFHEVLEKKVEQFYRLASPGEVKTLLYRSIKAINKQKPDRINVFEKDINSWVKVMTELAEENIDFTQSLHYEIQDQFISEDLRKATIDLQKDFYYGLRNNKNPREFYPRAALEYLDHKFQSKKVVIMEGFTFLTKTQKAFVKKVHQQGNHVIFVVPYRYVQSIGYEIIDQTYNIIKFEGKINEKSWFTKSHTKDKAIKFLQENLFTTEQKCCKEPSQHIELKAYLNRDLEIRGCVEQIQAWLNEGYQPEQIAVVMRSPEEFMGTFADYLAMQPLQYIDKDGDQKDVAVYTSPRLLLLTPLGRFVLSLYEIWHTDGHIEMNPEQFENFLNSGWLGPILQDSFEKFRAIKNQFFLQCLTKEEWDKVLGDLQIQIQTQSGSDRIPISLLNKKNTVQEWKNMIGDLEKACNKLFSTEDGPIGMHIKTLQTELNLLMPDVIRKAEREVLNKIKKVFVDLQDSFSIHMSTSEFQRAINSLSQERPDPDEIDDISNRPGHLWLTSPEGIDNIARECVIYLGVDQEMVPLPSPISWPRYKDTRDFQMNKERYMFLTVIRSATERLILTYAKHVGRNNLGPSIYMREVSECMKVPITPINVGYDLNTEHVYELKDGKFFSTRLKEYSLNELVQYGLCPQRYRFEKLHPEAKTYRDKWQLKFLVKGVWLENIYKYMTEEFGKQRPLLGREEHRFEQFLQAMGKVRPVIERQFPSFPKVVIDDIESSVEKHIRWGMKNYYKSSSGREYQVSYTGSWTDSFYILLPDRAQRNIEIKVQIPYTFLSGYISLIELSSLKYIEWLRYTVRPDDQNINPNLEVDGVLLFDSQYKAISWWHKTIHGFYLKKNPQSNRNAYSASLITHYEDSKIFLQKWILGIEKNRFPRNTGSHCIYCPVRLECLGKESEDLNYD